MHARLVRSGQLEGAIPERRRHDNQVAPAPGEAPDSDPPRPPGGDHRLHAVGIRGANATKGPGSDWFRLGGTTVYFDHPIHAMAAHTLNLDFAAPEFGPSARVAVELTEASARALIRAIEDALPGSHRLV
jgi:hypothetical protein